MELRYIIAGLVFFFNPCVNIIDILPDVIGCALMLYGLSRLRDLSPDLMNTRHTFWQLFYVELAKAVLSFIIPFMRDPGYLMIATFCFTLAEAGLLLLAVSRYFNGILFLCTRFDSAATAARINSVRLFSIVFVILRSVCTLLPEMIYLYINEDLGYVLASFKMPLIVLAFILSLTIGIIWLIKMVRFHRIMAADAAFIENMERTYRETILPQRSLFLRRTLKNALLLIGFGLALFSDLYFDGINWLPDAAGALFILAGLLLIRRSPDISGLPTRAALTAGGVYTLLSAAEWLISRSHAKTFYNVRISRSIEAYQSYLKILFTAAAELIAAIAWILLLTVLLLRIAKRHTGKEDTVRFESERMRNQSILRSLRGWIIASAVLGITAACSAFASEAMLYLWPTYQLIDVIVQAVRIAVLIKAMSALYEQIENKYL